MKEKSIKLTILGELGSKSNSRRIVLRGRRPSSIKSQKALDYETSAFSQLHTQLQSHVPYEDYVSLTVDVYYASRRPDLDIALLQDILQYRVDKKTGIQLCKGVYLNDRQVIEIHARKFWDKENPRCEIEVREIGLPS